MVYKRLILLAIIDPDGNQTILFRTLLRPVYKRYFSVPQKVYDKAPPEEDDSNVYDMAKKPVYMRYWTIDDEGCTIYIVHPTQITVHPSSSIFPYLM